MSNKVHSIYCILKVHKQGLLTVVLMQMLCIVFWKAFIEVDVKPSFLCVFPCVCLQMTAQEVRLCSLLLREHFGDVVEKVGSHLLRSGAQNLRTIIHETGITVDLVLLLHLLSQTDSTPWKYYYTLYIL